MATTPAIPDFELLRWIGGGAYGDVWLGRSLTGIYRAVKIVDRSRFEDERPFLREFDGIMRFQQAVGTQPRQLALLHVGRDEPTGILYYIMELADDALAGTNIDPATYVPLTLKELRARRGLVSTKECRQIAVELASALVGLHGVGLIHRDVKPSNIIFVNGLAKLADVGLVASSDHTLTSIGTPGYAPPEGSGTASADIYSLGKILYELSTGLSPSEFPRVPLEIAGSPEATPFFELNEIILRACDPDPSRRYETAQHMLDELMLLQAGRSVKELNRMKRTLRRLLRAGGFVVAAVALIACVLGVKNYFAMKQIAAQEIALRNQAKINERFARYTSDLHQAQLAFANGDFAAARAALRHDKPSKDEEDIRGYEWHALWNELTGNSAEIFGQPADQPVSAMQLSPDGSLVATQEGETSGQTAVWELASHTRRIVATNTSRLGGFSSDGARLLVGTAQDRLYQVEVATGARLPDLPIKGFLIQALPDGRTLLLNKTGTNDATLFLWDLVDQQKTAEWHYRGRSKNVSLTAAALSSDRRWLAASVFWTEGLIRKREVIVYNLAGQKEQFRSDKLGAVQKLEFSPDGLRLAIAMYGPVAIWDTATGKEISRLLGHSGAVRGVAFSKDGQLVATGSTDQTTRIWDVTTGIQQSLLRGHEGNVRAVIWSPTKNGLISAGEDGTCRRWLDTSVSPSKVVRQLWPDVFGDFIFSPDGTSITTNDYEGDIITFDPATLKRGVTFKGAFLPLAFSQEKNKFLSLSVDLNFVLCDLATGVARPLGAALAGKDKPLHIEVSPSRTYAAFAYENKTIEIWSLASMQPLDLLSPEVNQIGAIAWSAKDTHLAVADRFGKVVIHPLDRTAGAPEVLPPQKSAVFSLAFSADEKWLAIGREDGHLAIWNISEKRIAYDVLADGGRINCMAFTPDSTRLVTSADDGNILFWKVDGYQQISSWPWRGDSPEDRLQKISRIKFDGAGGFLGIWIDDGRMRIWNLRRDPEVAQSSR